LSPILHQRAKVGALSRSRPDDDPELVEAKRALAEAKIADYVEKVLEAAPQLTDVQMARLSELFRPVPQGSGGAA
jgi:hypothetical protein